ncbi:Hypothetical protein SRAE_1000312400 [Strongyloides ratti]|uniref:Uncharacterized protein n=1 Tax=Strongyloides ratti TaxID=34506 RepID=A0A090L4Z6_STRRB|nr:Hypothetical protein SRAE_1000312400 [Strongyloides ratti]CEF64871.1 Hypothetical protein SRAE_1000312400 [Strongyloides ratti]
MAITERSVLGSEITNSHSNTISPINGGMFNKKRCSMEIKNNNNINESGGAIYFNPPTNMSEEVQNLYLESVHFSIDDEEKLLLEEDIETNRVEFGTNFRNKAVSKIQSFRENHLELSNGAFHSINLVNNRNGSNFSKLTRLTNEDTDQDSPLDELNLILPISGTSFPSVKPLQSCSSTWRKIKNIFSCCYSSHQSTSMGILK